MIEVKTPFISNFKHCLYYLFEVLKYSRPCTYNQKYTTSTQFPIAYQVETRTALPSLTVKGVLLIYTITIANHIDF